MTDQSRLQRALKPSERIEFLCSQFKFTGSSDADARWSALCLYLDEREEQVHPIARAHQVDHDVAKQCERCGAYFYRACVNCAAAERVDPGAYFDGDTRSGPNGTRIRSFWGYACELCKVPGCLKAFAAHVGESHDCPQAADSFPERFAGRVSELLHPAPASPPGGDSAELVRQGLEFQKAIQARGERMRQPTALEELREVPGALGGMPTKCWCLDCFPEPFINGVMRLCSLCGNKRCPHALDHRNLCTSSNALDQTPVTWVSALVDCRNERDTLRARVEELTESCTGLRNAVSTWEADYNKLAEAEWGARQRISQFEGELAGASRSQSVASRERDDAIVERDTLRTEVNRLNAEAGELRRRLATERQRGERWALDLVEERLKAHQPRKTLISSLRSVQETREQLSGHEPSEPKI